MDTTEDLNELNDVVTDYIHFCVANVIKTKCIQNNVLKCIKCINVLKTKCVPVAQW